MREVTWTLLTARPLRPQCTHLVNTGTSRFGIPLKDNLSPYTFRLVDVNSDVIPALCQFNATFVAKHGLASVLESWFDHLRRLGAEAVRVLCSSVQVTSLNTGRQSRRAQSDAYAYDLMTLSAEEFSRVDSNFTGHLLHIWQNCKFVLLKFLS